MLFHFSEDSSIAVFLPHVPRSNPLVGPAVWAIDLEHSPLYWFPRECPRVTAWPRNDEEAEAFRAAFETTSHRVHVMEAAWAERMQSCRLFRYSFDPALFEPWPDAEGQYIAKTAVTPTSVEEVGNLFEAHEQAKIDLRLVTTLTTWKARAQQGPWSFSIVRFHNAQIPPAE